MKETLQNYRRVLGASRARWVLAGLAVSVVGDGAARVAILLRVHDEGGGPSGLAVVLVLFALPLVLLAGVAGVLADRPDPRPVVVGAAAVQLTATIVLALTSGLAWTGGAAFVLQTGFALGNSVWMVALPRLVAEEDAGALISLHHGLLALATPTGAALGGVLVQHVGTAAPFALDAVTFVVLMGVGLALSVGPAPADPTPAPGVLRTLLPLDGMAALRRHRLLAVLTGAVLSFVVAVESVNAIEVFLVRDVLGGSSAFFGFTEGAAGVGVACGALLSAGAHSTRARVRMILWAIPAMSLAVIGQGLAPAPGVYLLLGVAVGLLLGGLNAVFLTLMVTETDADTRGRVVAFVGGAARSCTMIALAIGGVLGTVLGPREAFVVVGAAGVLIGVVALRAAAGADCRHGIDGDGHRPGQRPRGGAAPQRRSLQGQDRDHRRGDPVELPRVR